MSCRLLRVTLRSIGSISAIEGHEDVLEIRLLHVERFDVEPREGLHERRDLPLAREAADLPVASELPYAQQAGERRRRGLLRERRLDTSEGTGPDRLDPVD